VKESSAARNGERSREPRESIRRRVALLLTATIE
jgi:hypothetical protein